jgi:hypothetical protein
MTDIPASDPTSSASPGARASGAARRRRVWALCLVLAAALGVLWWLGDREDASRAHGRAVQVDASDAAAGRGAAAVCTQPPCVDIRPLAAASADPRAAGQAAAGEESYLRMLAGRLALEHDGRSQALAAMLLRVSADMDDQIATDNATHAASSHSNDADTWERLRSNALALSPEDGAVAAWLTAGLDDGAEREAALAHWQQVEPWNLAPLLALQPKADPEASAEDRADLAEADALFLRSLGSITGYDTKLNAMRYALVAAVRRYPPTAAQLEMLYAQGPLKSFPRQQVGQDMLAMVLSMALWVNAIDAPFSPLLRTCKSEVLARMPQRHAGCVALGTRLQQRSDTVLGAMIGIALLRHAALHAQDREAMAATRVMRDRLDWMMTQYNSMQSEDPAKLTAAQLAAMQQLVSVEVAALMDGGPERVPYSEQALMRAVLVAMGKPAEPPPGWRSDFKFPDERTPEQTRQYEQRNRERSAASP